MTGSWLNAVTKGALVQVVSFGSLGKSTTVTKRFESVSEVIPALVCNLALERERIRYLSGAYYDYVQSLLITQGGGGCNTS